MELQERSLCLWVVRPLFEDLSQKWYSADAPLTKRNDR